MSNNYDDNDVGIYMKQDSVISFCEPTPPSPSSPVNGNKSPLRSVLEVNNVELKRNVSYGNMENTTEARVLVIYTGGTIGMIRNNKNGKVVDDSKFESRKFHYGDNFYSLL